MGGGFSELISGLIAAAIGTLSMLMSEPTTKSNVKRTRVFVLSLATLLKNELQILPSLNVIHHGYLAWTIMCNTYVPDHFRILGTGL